MQKPTTISTKVAINRKPAPARPRLSIPSRIVYDNKDIAFSQYGEYWRQVKSIAVVHLLSNKRVQSYEHVRLDEMGLMMDKILRSNGSVFNLSELIITLTNNVVCRVALGRTYEGRKFKNLLHRTMELLGCFSVGSYIPSLKWVDRLSGLVRKADDVAKEFDELLEGVIEEHLNEKRVGVEGRDLVDILLELQRDKLKGFRLERDMVKAIILSPTEDLDALVSITSDEDLVNEEPKKVKRRRRFRDGCLVVFMAKRLRWGRRRLKNLKDETSASENPRWSGEDDGEDLTILPLM
ncbi:hypothetical protein E3N88_10796 [Mikania micrantha]|uniref:Cytochrome P450 n=1 Tax=Mikania micrantha TaxID=192012 RepID=A0A5N6PBR8_9ASTR|nr:hypothetical protein E3N88_10796 [Mikania micrantha]